eukprot:TRINITY_DN57682_c0_g1_i1.p1 TRINITY_DN57682_c0_g1~~TRINITY_DN57682_c0_g1_i1.p1  ORF type:complete len:1185 (-),score=146.95 TRINITY_DN57682_c0_g1_i1:209-3763(-)
MAVCEDDIRISQLETSARQSVLSREHGELTVGPNQEHAARKQSVVSRESVRSSAHSANALPSSARSSLAGRQGSGGLVFGQSKSQKREMVLTGRAAALHKAALAVQHEQCGDTADPQGFVQLLTSELRALEAKLIAAFQSDRAIGYGGNPSTPTKTPRDASPSSSATGKRESVAGVTNNSSAKPRTTRSRRRRASTTPVEQNYQLTLHTDSSREQIGRPPASTRTSAHARDGAVSQLASIVAAVATVKEQTHGQRSARDRSASVEKVKQKESRIDTLKSAASSEMSKANSDGSQRARKHAMESHAHTNGAAANPQDLSTCSSDAKREDVPAGFEKLAATAEVESEQPDNTDSAGEPATSSTRADSPQPQPVPVRAPLSVSMQIPELHAGQAGRRQSIMSVAELKEIRQHAASKIALSDGQSSCNGASPPPHCPRPGNSRRQSLFSQQSTSSQLSALSRFSAGCANMGGRLRASLASNRGVFMSGSGNGKVLPLTGLSEIREKGEDDADAEEEPADGEMPPSSPRMSQIISNRSRRSLTSAGTAATSLLADDDMSSSSSSESGSEDCIHFPLKDTWKDIGRAIVKNRKMKRCATGMILARANTRNLETGTTKEFAEDERNKNKRCRLVRPDNPFRMCWDIFSAYLIFFDVVRTPLAFLELGNNGFTGAMTWVTRIFWSLDMPASLCTAYYRPDGTLEMAPMIVAKRYAQSWLMLDVFIVGCDWAEVFLTIGVGGVSSDAARISKIIRVIRVIRMMRLLRLAKLPGILERLNEYVPLELMSAIRTSAAVFKILGMILVLTHCMACAWIYIGQDSEDQGLSNWVAAHRDRHAETGDTEYLYFTSFHWTLTQFTGTMEVNPWNVRERVFAIVSLLFSFILSAAFVSTITSSMTRYQIDSMREAVLFKDLRRYLTRNRISPKLMLRLQRNAQHVLHESKVDIREADVEVLGMCSEPLRIELHLELNAPALTEHPFFKRYLQETPLAMRKICHLSVQSESLHQGDIVFTEAEAPSAQPSMFFVRSGQLIYQPISEEGQDESECELVPVSAGTWVCEAVLWVELACYFGTLRATTGCKLVTLNAVSFQEQTSSFINENFHPVHYGKMFAKLLSKTPVQYLSDLPDISAVAESLGVAVTLAESRSRGALDLGDSMSRFSENHGRLSSKQSRASSGSRVPSSRLPRAGDRQVS